MCLVEKPLLKKSHIIPDFFYAQGNLYDENHQITKFDVQSFACNKRYSKVPSGVYDKLILCADCDNKLISNLETYGRKVLFGGLNPSEEIKSKHYKNPMDGFEYIVFENVDYKKFKLFLLSILWRASISKHDLFKDVIIPEDIENKLRTMILNNDPGNLNDFPIITMNYLRDESVPEDLIGQPIRSENNKGTFITFLLVGFVFVFSIATNYNQSDVYEHFTPTPDNTFGILNIPKGQAWNFILKYLKIK